MTYGRSPAMDILADVEMFNRQYESYIRVNAWRREHMTGVTVNSTIFGFVWKTTSYHRYAP